MLFLPLPAWMIDMGLAFSVAISVLILMVALWIRSPLLLCLSDGPSDRNSVASGTQHRVDPLILSDGHKGIEGRGPRDQRLLHFVMSGDFVIGRSWSSSS